MYVIGLDIGTTGTKAMLVNKDGILLGSAYQEYKLMSKNDCVEQDANDWWKASIITIKEASKDIDVSLVEAIGVSTQGATMVAVDKNGNTINNAITWLDSRAKKQVYQIREKIGEEYIYQNTGWRLSPALDAAKIHYMKGNESYKTADKYISTLEYINYKLTNRMVIDPTNAGIRQLFNVKKGDWDENILKAINCSKEELPEILPTGALVGTLKSEAAKELGLCEDVKVYNGAHDQYCASIGSGAVVAGDMLVSTGTTWAVMGITEKALFTPTYIASCLHPSKGLFGNMVSLTGAGISYQWIKDSVFSGESFMEIDNECKKRIKKNKDLFYIPWISGALYPYWLPNARGGFHGVDLSTDKYDFALSIMEAAAFNVKAAIEDFEQNGCVTQSIRIMGGATKSEVWMGILKSILDIPIHRMNVVDTCAIGAASIALCASGYFDNYKQASAAMVKSEEILESDYSKNFYAQKYESYKKLLKHMSLYYKGEQNNESLF